MCIKTRKLQKNHLNLSEITKIFAMEVEQEIDDMMNDIVRPKSWRDLEKCSPENIIKFLPSMLNTTVFHNDFTTCEKIIKKLNRAFAWNESFIVKVEILLVRFSILGVKFRLNTKAKICPNLFVLLDRHVCASALSMDPNHGLDSVFKTASAQLLGVVSQIRYADFKNKCLIAKESALILKDHMFLAQGLLERCESTFEFNQVRKVLKGELGARNLPTVPKNRQRMFKK